MNTSASQRSTRLVLRPGFSQVSPNSKSASPWTRKNEIFRLSSTGHVDLGPQEEEIERLYNQMKDLMECLNDKLEENSKKKEEMCMIAFRKAMRSIEEDLKDMRQQINIATKTTRDASDEEAAWTIQKQLSFFREESVILSKKLKEAEAAIKELKLKNQQLDYDARSEHLLLIKSQKEVRRLKDLLERKDKMAGVDKNQDEYTMPMTNRSKSPNNNSKGKKFENIESKYKRENIHVNLLRQHLEETLKKKADYLSLDKIDELVDLVADRVNHKFQIQEQQIDTLQAKLLKIKQYYQYVVRRDTGTNLPSGLHDILFIFWDMFSTYKVKPNNYNSSHLLRSSRSRPTSRSKSPSYQNNLSNSPYASVMTLDKADRSSVMDSIKASNTRYSLFNNEDKVKLIQKTLEDPAVEAVLTYHTDAHRFIRREGRSPVEQLMRLRDQSSMANSRAQTPGGNPVDPSEEADSVGNYQETIRDKDHDYLWNYSRPVTGNKRLNSASGSARKALFRPDQNNNNNSPASGMEYSHSHEKSQERQEGLYSLRLESHLSSMVLPPIEDYGSKGELTQVTKEDDNDELIENNNENLNNHLGMGRNNHQNDEVFEPAEPMEGVGGRDFRRKFQVRPSKNASINEG